MIINSFHSLSLCFLPTNQFGIIKIIDNLKTSSHGYDDIRPKILRQMYTFILPLCHIINCSLASGVVQSNFKVVKALPIFYNGQLDDLHNYRPVSILPSF